MTLTYVQCGGILARQWVAAHAADDCPQLLEGRVQQQVVRVGVGFAGMTGGGGTGVGMCVCA